MHAPRPACAAVEAKPLQIVSALFLGWTILSALFSPFEGTWLGLGQHGGVLTTLLYGLLFLMVCAYGSWDFRFLHLLGAGVVVFNAVIGLLQYAGLNPLYLYSDGTNFHDAFVLYNGAFLGTLGNVDLLSAFLCLTVPVFYSAFLLTGRKTALLPMGSGVFLLMLADVDSGYLGLAARPTLAVSEASGAAAHLIPAARYFGLSGAELLYLQLLCRGRPVLGFPRTLRANYQFSKGGT